VKGDYFITAYTELPYYNYHRRVRDIGYDTTQVHGVSKTRNMIFPRDAMLVQYMLSSCVRVSVHPSVRYKPVLYQTG